MKSILIEEDFLPIAWEKAVMACWEHGESFATEYDRLGDPMSKDVTCIIHVKEPLADPRIHRGIPAGLDDLEKYRSEVIYGVHDHWINADAGKWSYTYHQRLFAYDTPGSITNQINQCVERLKKTPHTRRAQAVTWQVWNDPNVDDPACLQRLWFRISDGKLHMNCHMRSNDAFKAAYMNMYAFTELQAEVAKRIGVLPGEYMHIVDSFHIYGSYFNLIDGFIKMSVERSIEERTYSAAYANEFFVDGCDVLLSESDLPAEIRKIVCERREYLRGKTR